VIHSFCAGARCAHGTRPGYTLVSGPCAQRAPAQKEWITFSLHVPPLSTSWKTVPPPLAPPTFVVP
jgi:hypothetical protein